MTDSSPTITLAGPSTAQEVFDALRRELVPAPVTYRALKVAMVDAGRSPLLRRFLRHPERFERETVWQAVYVHRTGQQAGLLAVLVVRLQAGEDHGQVKLGFESEAEQPFLKAVDTAGWMVLADHRYGSARLKLAVDSLGPLLIEARERAERLVKLREDRGDSGI